MGNSQTWFRQVGSVCLAAFTLIPIPGYTQEVSPGPVPSPVRSPAPPMLDIDPTIVQQSPVLQRWLKHPPNVLQDIHRDPSFRTRLRAGYSQVVEEGGWAIGVEDVFIGQTGLTVSGDYQSSFQGNRSAGGVDIRYYLRPLGSYLNVAPLVGYRYLNLNQTSTDGAHVGLRLLLVPSRGGGADLALTQSWVAPGTEGEVGLTALSFGYALSHQLRLSSEIQWQNSRQGHDQRLGLMLEWMP